MVSWRSRTWERESQYINQWGAVRLRALPGCLCSDIRQCEPWEPHASWARRQLQLKKSKHTHTPVYMCTYTYHISMCAHLDICTNTDMHMWNACTHTKICPLSHTHAHTYGHTEFSFWKVLLFLCFVCLFVFIFWRQNLSPSLMKTFTSLCS